MVRGSWVWGVIRRYWPCLWPRGAVHEDLGGSVYIARVINVREIGIMFCGKTMKYFQSQCLLYSNVE